jgi:predicted exporter
VYVFGVTCAAAVLGLILISRVSFDANVLHLLPRRTPSVRDYQLFLQDFGSLDHLYIVFESDGAIAEHTGLVDAYVEGLKHVPEVESVDAELFEPGKDWTYLLDRQLYLLGADGAAAALSRFRPPTLERELTHARELLSMPSSQVKTFVQQDPLGLLTALSDRMGRGRGILSANTMQNGYVSADGRSRLVIVKPKGQPFDTDFCKALFRRLTEVETKARQLASADDPDASTVTIKAAGAYRVSLEAEQLIRREGIINSVATLVVLLLVLFAVFRTSWVLVYGCLPLAIAALLTLGINGVLRGSLSPAVSGSAAMLFGLGIDGVVMLYARYLEERQHGASPDAAVSRSASTARSVALAQLTTAASFFALLFGDFPTLRELGSLVGIGIVICCALVLLLLPALLVREEGRQTGRDRTTPWLGRGVTRRPTPLIWIGVIVTIALGVASIRLRLDTGIERLQAQTGGAQVEKEVADRFSLPQDVLLVLNENTELEPLLDADTRLTDALARRAPSVAVSGIDFMLPPAREQARVSEALRRSGVTKTQVEQDVEAAAKQVGFRAGTFGPFFDRLPRLLDPEARVTYDGLIEHGLGSITSRFVTFHDGRFKMVTYVYPQRTTDLAAVRQVVSEVDSHLRLTGLPVINRDLRQQFLPEFLKGLGIGIVAVALLVYLVFRTVLNSLLVLLPTAVGFVWSAGLLALLGVELDLFSLFAVVTFVGISVDYSIYVLHGYVFDRASDMQAVLTTTGGAILIAFSMTLIGFGSLVTSSYRPLHVFGIVSLVTLTSCLVASIVLLPAVVLELERWSSSRLSPPSTKTPTSPTW